MGIKAHIPGSGWSFGGVGGRSYIDLFQRGFGGPGWLIRLTDKGDETTLIFQTVKNYIN